MASKLFSLLTHLTSNFKPTSRLLSQSPFQNSNSIRSVHSKRSRKKTLHGKIGPLGTPGTILAPVMDEWIKSGKKVHQAELRRLIRDLRGNRRYTQALEVSEWMGNNVNLLITGSAFSSGDRAVQLDLTGRVHGSDSAESYFDSLGDEDKTDKTYGALLNCYTRAGLINKSLSHMQKMKEMGFASSSLPYNDLMCLYANTSQHEKVPGLLNEMKENGVIPNNFSYRCCVNAYGTRSDINGMEKVLEEMENQQDISMDSNTYLVAANFYIKAGLTDKATASLKKAEEKLGPKDAILYNHLISLYASLGNKAEVTRLWNMQNDVCKRHINRDYITMLGSLVKLEELEEAEKLLEEWEKSDNSYDFRVPNVLLIGYSQKHMVEKAEAVLDDLVAKGKTPTPNSWGIVAAGYVHKKEMKSALRCMKMAFSVRESNERWKPSPKVVYSIVRWLGDEGKVEEVEAFVGLLKTVITMDREIYHALIKANIREGKEVNGLLESMKADSIEEDEETKKILNSKVEELAA